MTMDFWVVCVCFLLGSTLHSNVSGQSSPEASDTPTSCPGQNEYSRLEDRIYQLEDRLACTASTLDQLASGSLPSAKPKDCSDIYQQGRHESGTYWIWPKASEPVNVLCHFDSDGAWTVLQRRVNGNTDFQRTWIACKHGFGELAYYSNFWLGLEPMHHITNQRQYTLRVDITDWDGTTKYAEYSTFSIGDESHLYNIVYDGYSGTAGDALGAHHKNANFSTFDRDNDNLPEHCSRNHRSPWWYNGCDWANLNSVYQDSASYEHTYYDWGIEWTTFKTNFYSFKESCMRVKPTFDDNLN